MRPGEELARALAQLPRVEADGSWLVPSASIEGLLYRVDIALDGEPVCECPGYYYWRHCRHSDAVREERRIMTSQALVPIQLSPPPSRAPTKVEIDTYREVAAIAYEGGLALPEGIKSKAQILSLMLYGRALGLPDPMLALQELDLVKGQIVPRAKMMASLARQREPSIVLDFPELDEKHVKVHFERPSRGIKVDREFTWEGHIKKAHLDRDANLLYPEDRLAYYAIKRFARLYFWDLIVLSPVGALPEVDDEDDEEEAAAPAGVIDGKATVIDTPNGPVDRETGEIMAFRQTTTGPEDVRNTSAMQAAKRERDAVLGTAAAEEEPEDLPFGQPEPEPAPEHDADWYARAAKLAHARVKATVDREFYTEARAEFQRRFDADSDPELVFFFWAEVERLAAIPPEKAPAS